MIKIPEYDNWIIIYNKKDIIGYTHTYSEAEDLCKKNHNYSWDYCNIIKLKTKRNELYNSLKQLVST